MNHYLRKTLTVVSVLALSSLLFSGCAFVGSPVLGSIYTDVQAPLAATSNSVGTKVGTAEATSILGIVATGDASINQAAKNGNITSISHVDYHATSILGVYATFTVMVYGE
ncbi:MAG: TRL-like family protein [Candidatus Cyclobacteriaceae bacterium M3_2C_046]